MSQTSKTSHGSMASQGEQPVLPAVRFFVTKLIFHSDTMLFSLMAISKAPLFENFYREPYSIFGSLLGEEYAC